LLIFDRLDSRQRKKKHTEELEKEQKSMGDRNRSLEVQMKEMQDQLDALFLERQNLHSHVQNLHHEVETLKSEKEEIVMKHTLETTTLRKKINVLKSELEHLPPIPQQSEYNFTSELENLSMNPDGDWSNWMADFPELDDMKPSTANAVNPETTLVVGQRRRDTLVPEVNEKQMVSSSFLFLFLLYGAFVATRASSSTTVPPMAPEYRAEAQTILNQVLHENAETQNSAQAQMNDINTVVSWIQQNPSQTGHLPTFSPPARGNPQGVQSPLDSLTNQILTPTKQQEAEEAFSLTPDQYNSLTSMDFTRGSYQQRPVESNKPRNPSFAELLEARRKATQPETAAEVYTRSLMWDRVPPEVVQEFRKLVSENENAERDAK
jgi:hypothetical protein